MPEVLPQLVVWSTLYLRWQYKEQQLSEKATEPMLTSWREKSSKTQADAARKDQFSLNLTSFSAETTVSKNLLWTVLNPKVQEQPIKFARNPP